MMPILKAAKASLEHNSALQAEAKALRLIARAGGVHAAIEGAEMRKVARAPACSPC